MEPGDWILFAVVGTLAANQAVLRLSGWERRPWLFWAIQLLNLGVATYLMAVGIPGFEGNLRVVDWVIGLLFTVRIVQNNGRYARARREARKKAAEGDDARRREILEALERGEGAPRRDPDEEPA